MPIVENVNTHVAAISAFLTRTITTLKSQNAYVLPIYVNIRKLPEIYNQRGNPLESWPEEYKNVMTDEFDNWNRNIGTELDNLRKEAVTEIETHAVNLRGIISTSRKAGHKADNQPTWESFVDSIQLAVKNTIGKAMKLNINGFLDSIEIPFKYVQPESTTPKNPTSIWDHLKFLFYRGGNRKAFDELCEISMKRNKIDQMSFFVTKSFNINADHLGAQLALKSCQSHASCFNQYKIDYKDAVEKAANENKYCNRLDKEIKSEHHRYVALEDSFKYFKSERVDLYRHCEV